MASIPAPSRALPWLRAILLVAFTLLSGPARAAENTGDKQAVIAVNQAFYKAFRTKDVGAMDMVWAKNAQVSVIHPGWNAILGREKVMSSWRRIIESGGAPEIYALHPAVLFRENTAIVLCYEKIESSYLIATNIFVLEDGAWRMIHHHAGPAPAAGTLFKGEPA